MVNRGLAARFTAAAEAAGAEVISVARQKDAYVTVARILDREKAKKVAASASVRESGCAGRLLFSNPGNPLEFAQARVALVRADYGAAETGTLVRLDSEDDERLLWSLPATCIALLDGERVVPGVDSLDAVISGHLERRNPPASQVSLITGPSRTADIECALTIGVQGPARLIILLIDEPEA
jgi:L-lactate dehydrogenase complex protein LldG